MDNVCPDYDNGKYRPPEQKGVLYWIFFFWLGLLFAATHSLTRKRMSTCPTCGRFYD
jgi:hypothetical protein